MAREVRDPQRGNKPVRTRERLDAGTLPTVKAADAPASPKAFSKFQDPPCKRGTVSLR